MPFTKRTSTWPKSCCVNSPGNLSKRTTGRVAGGRNDATSAYALLPPVCRAAVQLYREHLSDDRTFASVTLETVVTAIAQETSAAWSRT